jgi:excisionase family DNA binding protein
LKTDLEQQDIEAIAQRVKELLRPMLTSNGKNETEDILFNKNGLAKYLLTSRSTIDKLVSNNQIPFFKISKGQTSGVRFNKQAIDRWIKNKTVPETCRLTLKKILPHS